MKKNIFLGISVCLMLGTISFLTCLATPPMPCAHVPYPCFNKTDPSDCKMAVGCNGCPSGYERKSGNTCPGPLPRFEECMHTPMKCINEEECIDAQISGSCKTGINQTCPSPYRSRQEGQICRSKK